MTTVPKPRPAALAHVLPTGIDAIAAATALAAAADERHVLLQLVALAVRDTVAIPGGRFECRIKIDADVYARIAEATQIDLPDPIRTTTAVR